MDCLRVIETDVLVIGGAITAARAAIAAHDQGAEVMLVDKGIFGKSGAGPVAYSVTAALIKPPDSKETFYEDMIKSGQGLNNKSLVKAFVEDVARGRVLELENFGIVFARGEDGKLSLRQMGGHSYPRDIASFHAASMVNVLVLEVMRRNIKVYSDVMITRLLTDQGRVVGAVGLDKKKGDLIVFRAKAIVLTAGGAGQAYGPGEVSGYTTTLMEITADSYAMAYRIGADLVDMEFVQFITAIAYPDVFKGILAGEPAAHNAKLYNSKNERFMQRYDVKRMENTTKDVLAAAIIQEVREGRGTPHGGVWMDFSAASHDSLHIFPYPFEEMGIDPKKDRVEIMPAAHYFMGGVKIDEKCQANVQGLYAAGEAAGGLHGANRLAGCSTADSNVFGARAGRFSAEEANTLARPGINWEQVKDEQRRIQSLLKTHERKVGITPVKLKRKLQTILWNDVGALRSKADLSALPEKLALIKEEYENNLRLRQSSLKLNNEIIEALEIYNIIDFTGMISRAALLREETRGAHYREDFPKRDDQNWLKNIIIRCEAGEMKVTTIPAV
jgi:fumarate reductase (CoM/CoB) subunit A